MANISRPTGFITKGDVMRENTYVAGGTIYPGDMVLLDATGRVVAGSATSALLGCANAYATVGLKVQIFDHPDQLYTAQADDAAIDALTDLNLNYDLLATAGEPVYKVSRMQIDSSTGATTATLPLKVIAVDQVVGNALGAFVTVVCKINNHQLAGGTGTAGV